jgi:hypothetical protein
MAMDDATTDRWALPVFDCDRGLLLLHTEDGAVSLEAGWSLEVDGQPAARERTLLACSPGEGVGEPGPVVSQYAGGVEWRLVVTAADEGRTVTIGSVITNNGERPVRLGACRLVEVGPDRGRVTLQGDAGQAVYLRSTGSTGPTRVHRCDEGDGFCRSLLHVVSHEAGRALTVGFVTFDQQTTEHRFAYDGAGFRSLECLCDFEGWELPPGGSVATETLTLEVSADPQVGLERWAERVHQHYQPPVWPKVTGAWLGWAWVDAFNHDVYEEAVLRNCRAIRRRLPGHDLEYVWVSIGNLKDGLPGNWLEWDYGNFPHGPEYLVEELRRLDFKLGFWCAPFWVTDADPERFAGLSEHMLTLDGQPVAAGGEWEYGKSGDLPPGQRPKLYSLDPTHPKTKEFVANVFATYREWGIRYYMVDFLTAVSGRCDGIPYDGHHDRSVPRGPQVLRQGLESVRAAAGDDTYLLSSSGPTFQNIGYINAARVGSDYGEGRALYPNSYFYPATFVINSANFWTSHKYASSNMAGTYFTHRKLYVNDSGNVMTVDKPIPVCEAQIVATIFGLGGGPVMLGDDLETITEDRLALIRKVFPRTSECAKPLDLFESLAPEDYPKLFWQHVATDWGEWELLAVLNYGDDPLVLPVPLARLGLDPAGQYRLWEFWNEQYLGVITGELRAVVPPRSVRLYRVAAWTEHPWLLGTDMHVWQGAVELSDVRWEAAAMTLSGSATRPAGETGSLFIAAPPGLCVTNPPGYYIAKDANDSSLVIRKPFVFDDEPARFAISFAPVADPGAG